MKRFWLALFIMVILLAGCTGAPSEKAVQTAIALTQAAQASTDAIPSPTATLDPTNTPTPTETPTETPTATPTPDLRIIDEDPKDLLLTKSEMPSEGRYYIPYSTWMSIHLNSEVVSGWTVERGRNYLEKSGRMIGWWVQYARGTSTVRMPEWVMVNVVKYRTAEGAQWTINNFSRDITEPEDGWVHVDRDLDLGDMNYIVKTSEITSGGDKLISYEISCSYRNIGIFVIGGGYEKDVSLEFVENIVREVLKKVEAAPLSEPYPPVDDWNATATP
ncbi:MAG: hypothetical protein ACYC3H_10875 [Bellilinea sp.]